MSDLVGMNAKADWVRRVLGVTPGPGASGGFDEAAFRKTVATARAAWRSANDTINQQLDALRKVLRDSPNPGLQRIGEFGLNGITGRRRTALESRLLEFDAAQGPALKTLAQATSASAQEFRTFIESDPRVAACDACPVTPVTLRKTLGTALLILERTLARAA